MPPVVRSHREAPLKSGISVRNQDGDVIVITQPAVSEVWAADEAFPPVRTIREKVNLWMKTSIGTAPDNFGRSPRSS
jgi:hypothetical protein